MKVEKTVISCYCGDSHNCVVIDDARNTSFSDVLNFAEKNRAVCEPYGCEPEVIIRFNGGHQDIVSRDGLMEALAAH